jgi:hypothetical protein
MARINTDGEAEKLRELFAARMEWPFCKPLASKLADVFSKTPPSRQARRVPCFFWMPILGTFLISSKARKAGPLAERVGDVVSQSRASSLVKGFENATPARNPGRRPASVLHPCSSESSVVSHAFFHCVKETSLHH